MSKPIDKQKKRTEEQVFYNLMQIVQNFPQYTLSQHLAHVLRRKSEAGDEFYYWNDDTLLKKFEDYHDELSRELSLQIVPETLL